MNETLCEMLREDLDIGAYVSFVQDHVVQAEYWHDPFNEPTYLKDNIFLPDINNEGADKNSTYVENLVSLNSFVMVRFLQDTMVQPIASEWFGFYAPGQDKVLIPLQKSQLYLEDWLGLQKMDKLGQLKFLSVNANHLQFKEPWFIENIIKPYLM